MRITLVAAGRLKEPPVRAVADDYAGRIARYVRFEEREARDDAALARLVPPGALLVALEVWGEQHSSEEFARLLEAWGRRGKGEIAFLIGGAEGLPPALSERAEHHLSLSRMTLPHRLARVVLLEQVYRALSIARGEPYAREG